MYKQNIILRFFLFFLVCILIIIPPIYAWTGNTHQWICDRANLTDINCASADYPKMQSEHPDINFKNHHCTANGYECSARKIADKYVAISSTTPYAREFAAHLYADSMVPVHWYSFDYDSCHKIFEDKVEEKLLEAENKQYLLFSNSYDFSVWNITMTCPAKFSKDNYSDVTLYVDNMYMDTVARYVSEQLHTSYVPTKVETIDLTPVAYFIIALLILILTLFIVFGLKNKNKN
jgi:hypothetical protein